MPLVWELTSEIKNWLTPDKLRSLNAGWRAQGTGFSDEVIEDLVLVLQMDKLHYENILGHLEVQLGRQPRLAQEYAGLYAWMVELVYQLLYYRQVHNDEFFDKHLKFYEGIHSLVDRSSSLWVFSLNHDLIVEAIAAKFSIPIYSGFGAGIVKLPRRNATGEKIGEICAELLTKEDLEERAMYFPNPPARGIYLLKLHGALDIFTFNDGEDILKLLPNGSDVSAVTATLRAANEELIYLHPGAPGGRVRATNEIAYADDTGEMQFLRRSLLAGAHKFDDRRHQVLPKSMLKHFRANLNFVTKLICIGYSFGDQHVNQVLRDWLTSSASRHLEIVGPGVTSMPDFFRHMAPQVTLVDSGATDYLDIVAGINRTRCQRLEKQVTAICRQLGKKQSAKLMSRFSETDLMRMRDRFVERLKSLPIKPDGLPDIGTVEDAKALAKTWNGEAEASREGILERLLAFLKADNSHDRGV